MFNDKKFGDIFPTRTGSAAGSANERKMLDALGGSEGFRTKLQNNADGSITMLRTKNGQPQFSTISPRPTEGVESLGGFVFQPKDGTEDPVATIEPQAWDAAFFKTTEYATSPASQLLRPIKTVQRSPEIKLHTKRKAKPVSWTGRSALDSGEEKECVVSWDHGLGSRYRLHADQDCSGRIIKYSDGVPEFAQSGTPGICVNGADVATSYESETINVVGAAVFNNLLVFVAHYDPYMTNAQRESKAERAATCSKTATVFYRTGGIWKVAGSHKVSSALKAPWFFSPDGSKASAIREPMASNQWMMHITLSFDNGVVSSSFSEAKIETTEAFYLDTQSDPESVVTTIPGHYDQPSDWSMTGNGSILFVVGGTDPLESMRYDIDFRPIGSYGDTLGISAELTAYMLANNNGYRGPYAEDNRIDGAIAGRELAGNNWSVCTYSTDDTIMLGAGGGTFGHVNTRSWRSSYYTWQSSNTKTTWKRSASGKRAIAVDYGFDGEFRVISESFESRSTGYMQGSGGTQTGDWIYHDFNTATWVSKTKVELDFNVSGTVNWVLDINGTEFLKVSGGVNDDGACSSAISKTDKEERTQHNDGSSPSVYSVETSYSAPSSSLHTERGWVIDADLRTKSCVYEKWRTDYTPHGLDISDIGAAMSVFNKRIECTYTDTSSLHVIYNSQEVYKIENTIGTGGTKLLRPYSTMMELTPRLHDLSENIEESTLVQYLSWNDGGALLEAWRVNYLLDRDLMPRSGGTDINGQIQSRNIDQTVISTRDKTTAQLLAGGDSSSAATPIHDVTYTTIAYIRGEENALLADLRDALSTDRTATDYATPREGFRIFPICAT